MSNDNVINLKPQQRSKGIRKKYSQTSVRMDLRVEPEERDSFKKMQEFLGMFTEGRRVSASVIVRRMLNLYTARLADVMVGVSQRIEAGELKESDRKDAIAEAMKPEIAALLRAGGHRLGKV